MSGKFGFVRESEFERRGSRKMVPAGGYAAVLLAAGWLGCAVLLRKEYPKQLASFLTHGDLSGERRPLQQLDRTTLGQLLAAFESGDEVKGLYALHQLQGTKDRQVVSAMQRLVREGSPLVQARALWVLAELGDSSLIAEAERLLQVEEFEIRIGAFHYLCRCRPGNLMESVKQILHKDDPRLDAAAIACLTNSGTPEELNAARNLIEKMLGAQGADGVETRRLLAGVLRHVPAPSALHFYLRRLLLDPSEVVVREALMTARMYLPREAVALVVEKLTNPRLRDVALDTLRVHGDKILGTLRDYVDDPTIPLEVRCALPEVFAGVGTDKAAADLLVGFHRPDPPLRRAVIQALNEIRDRNPQMEMDSAYLETFLAEELKAAYHLLRRDHQRASAEAQDSGEKRVASNPPLSDEYKQSVERVLGLLGLLFPQQSLLTACRGLQSVNPHLRANALELLDSLLPPRLKMPVLALVDKEIPIEERLLIAKTTLGQKPILGT